MEMYRNFCQKAWTSPSIRTIFAAMMNSEKMIASLLLDIEAVKLSPEQPFTWASGWKSPIYCDNRKTLSYPKVRRVIQEEFARLVREKHPDVEVIAGVATGAIALGILVAEALNLPFIYIRSGAKKHGMGNQIEGAYQAGQKVVVIEDLVSTGGSSLTAVAVLREANMKVLGMLAIFTYGFPVASENFKNAQVELTTLSNYHALLELAVEAEYIKDEQKDTLSAWRSDPSTWMQ